jgi:hypothetical protein
MSADLHNVEALSEELKRLKRHAATAILLAAGSFAVAVLALVAPYNAGLRAYVERVLYIRRQAPQSPATSVEPASVMEAQRFVVRDKAGQVRVELGLETDDRAELSLRDPDGTLRVVLATADSGTGYWLENVGGREHTALLGLFDRSGRRLADFGVTDIPNFMPIASVDVWSATLWDKSPSAGGVMLVANRDGGDLTIEGSESSRIDLMAKGEDYSPSLTMDDAAGKTRVDLSITSGAPSLDLSDKDGKKRASLEVLQENPSLDLFDNDGKVRASLEMNGDAASLDLFDKTRKTRATLGSASLETIKTGATEQTAESSLVLFDKKGKVIFRAPTE